MTKNMSKICNLLATIPTVLIVYLSLRSAQFVYSLLYATESTFLVIGRTLALICGFALCYMTYKRNIIAAWIMVFILSLAGISIFLFGIFAVPIAEYKIKSLSILMGAYFIYGGIILFKSIRKGEMKGIDSLMKA